MRTTILILIACLLCLTVGVLAANRTASAADKAGVVRHVVLLKFKDGIAPEKVREVEKAFVALKDKIDTVKALEWGTDISPEKLSQGFTHCFMLTFADEKGRDAYLPHPAHKEFGKMLGPVLDKVLVVDYKTGG